MGAFHDQDLLCTTMLVQCNTLLVPMGPKLRKKDTGEVSSQEIHRHVNKSTDQLNLMSYFSRNGKIGAWSFKVIDNAPG